MPSANVPLVGLERTVTMPVAYTVLNQIKTTLNLPDSTIIKVPSSTNDYNLCNMSGNTVKEDAVVHSDLRVTIEETQEDSSINTTGSYLDNQNPIIYDEHIGLKIWPIYVMTRLNINVSFKAKDKTVLTNWVNSLKVRLAQGGRNNIHTLEFRYVFPRLYHDLLHDVWELEEQVAPYGRDFSEYLRVNGTSRLVLASDVEGINLDLLCKEKQYRVIGNHDFTLPDKIEFDKDSAKWGTEFSYYVYYSKPVMMHVEYSVMVHNQLLAPKYLVKRLSIDDGYEKGLPMMHEMRSARFFETEVMDRYTMEQKPLRAPLVDDYVHESSYPFMQPIVVVLCQINESDKRTLVNLNDLDYIKLDKDLLNWIASGEKDYIPNMMASFIYIELIKNKKEKSKIPITIDSNLNVIASSDLDLRSMYHIVINIVKDCRLPNSRALKTAADSPLVKALVSNQLDSNIRQSNVIGAYSNRTPVTDDCFTRKGMIKTVQISSIVTVNSEDLITQLGQ